MVTVGGWVHIYKSLYNRTKITGSYRQVATCKPSKMPDWVWWLLLMCYWHMTHSKHIGHLNEWTIWLWEETSIFFGGVNKTFLQMKTFEIMF